MVFGRKRKPDEDASWSRLPEPTADVQPYGGGDASSYGEPYYSHGSSYRPQGNLGHTGRYDDDDRHGDPITYARGDKVGEAITKGGLTTGWNSFPIALLAIDIALSTSGLAVIFGPMLEGRWWAWLILAIASYALSSGQWYCINAIKLGARRWRENKKKPPEDREPAWQIFVLPILMAVFWLLDQALDIAGYTYATTQDREVAMHLLPSNPLPLWWGGLVFVLLCGIISEPAMSERARQRSRR